MSIVRQDTFSRANVASGWGTASDGNTWTIHSGDGQSVTSNEGQINSSTASTFATLGAALSGADAEGLVRFNVDASNDTGGILLRWTDSSNHWLCRYDGNGNIAAMVKVSGTYTTLSPTYALSPGGSTYYWLRFRVQSTTISFKVWQDGSSEPSSWTEQYTSQSSQNVAGNVGLYGFGNGITSFDHFSVDDLAASTHNLAADTQSKFLARAVLADGSRSHFLSAAVLNDESRSHFLSAAALKVEDRTQFVSRAALAAPSQSKFLIQAVLTQLLALGHAAFFFRSGLVSQAHSTFATRIPLATQLRDVFSTRFNLLAFARDAFISRSALVSLAQDIFKIQVAPGAPGTGIGDITRSTGTQTANFTGNGYGTGDVTGTEHDYSYKDVTGSGWAVGANPWYGGMPISAWYQLDPSLNTTLPQKTSATGNLMTLLTTQSGGIVHWEEESSGGTYASSELPTFSGSGNFTELAPTNTAFRAYIKCVGDATDANGIAWTAYACIYPGDPGFVVFRFDQHNPSGSAISVQESDVELIASLLTDAGQNPTGIWKRANGFIGTIGGSVTNGWPAAANHIAGTFDFMGITPDTGNGISLGTGAAVVADPSVQFSWTSGGYEANDTGTTSTPGRIKIGFYSNDPSTVWSIPSGQTNTYYVLRVFRRNLTSSDMAAIAADFKFPGTPSTTVGSFTTFSVDERAYTFSALANRLSATLDLTPANVTVRYKPIVKVTGWTSTNAPVLFWGGAALNAGTDYRFYIDTTNQVLYLQLYFDVVAAGAGTGQKNNAVLQVQAPNGLAAAVRTRYQIATGCGAVSRAQFSSAAALRAESRSSFASRTALVTAGRSLFFTRLNAVIGSRTRFITLANLSQALRVKEFIGAALATHAQDTFKVNPAVTIQPFLRIVFAVQNRLAATFKAATQLRATFSVLPALSATFTRSVSVPTPNTTITVTATAFDINNNPVANCSAVTCTVTFPDGTTQAFAMPATITNAGAGKYTLTYKTKGPGPHTEDWDFVAADTVTTCEAHNTTPVSF